MMCLVAILITVSIAAIFKIEGKHSTQFFIQPLRKNRTNIG